MKNLDDHPTHVSNKYKSNEKLSIKTQHNGVTQGVTFFRGKKYTSECIIIFNSGLFTNYDTVIPASQIKVDDEQ